MLTTLFSLVIAQNSNPKPGFGVAIDSANSFCLILPKNYGDDIAANDATGISCCWNNPKGGLPTREMPVGLIASSHYLKTNVYTQVTGTYNPVAYGLNPKDLGTQWDDSLAIQGGVMPFSGCANKAQYLEFFGGGVFCIRCCDYAFSEYCNPSDDTQGCAAGIPGDYGPGFSNAVGTAPPPKVTKDGNGCSPQTDSCATPSFVCCVASGDFARGLTTKTSCQSPGVCSSQAQVVAKVVLPVMASSIQVLAIAADPVPVTTTIGSGSPAQTNTGSSNNTSTNSAFLEFVSYPITLLSAFLALL